MPAEDTSAGVLDKGEDASSTGENASSTARNAPFTAPNAPSTTANAPSTAKNAAPTTLTAASTTANAAFTTANAASTTLNAASTTLNAASTALDAAFTARDDFLTARNAAPRALIERSGPACATETEECSTTEDTQNTEECIFSLCSLCALWLKSFSQAAGGESRGESAYLWLKFFVFAARTEENSTADFADGADECISDPCYPRNPRLIFLLTISKAAGYEWEKRGLSSNLGGVGRDAAFGAAGDQFPARLRRGAEIVATLRAATGAGKTATAGAAAEEEGEAGEGPGGGTKRNEPTP